MQISSTLQRVHNIDEQLQTSIGLQNNLSSLYHHYDSSDINKGIDNQERINAICLKLQGLIFQASRQQSKGTREGFNVTKSNRMGFHSKDGPLKGFTIQIGSKHYHDFKVHKMKDCEQEIWGLGLELWRMKKDNSGSTYESVCMEFGFMVPGDYVELVRPHCVCVFQIKHGTSLLLTFSCLLCTVYFCV